MSYCQFSTPGLLALLFIYGCNAGNNNTPAGGNAPPPGAAPAPSPAPAPPPPPNDAAPPYAGPPVTADLLQMESHPVQYAVAVTVTAPTGGWTLALDKNEIVGDTAKVYFTLEGPADDEMVTQVLAELDGRFVTTTPIANAEVYIHLAQRDIHTLTTNYRLAARAGVPKN